MRSDRQGTVIASVWTPRTATGKQCVLQKSVLIATLISLVAWFALGACAPIASSPGSQGKGERDQPELVTSASRTQDATRGTSLMPCRAGPRSRAVTW